MEWDYACRIQASRFTTERGFQYLIHLQPGRRKQEIFGACPGLHASGLCHAAAQRQIQHGATHKLRAMQCLSEAQVLVPCAVAWPACCPQAALRAAHCSQSALAALQLHSRCCSALLLLPRQPARPALTHLLHLPSRRRASLPCDSAASVEGENT